MHAHLLQDIGLCVLAATALAFVARFLRQPLILAYIGAGLLNRPPGLRWVRDEASIKARAMRGGTLLSALAV